MAENKTYDKIIRNITSGLTGDFEKDKAYLQEQMEKYKEHEMAQEILRACGRIMYQIMPEEMKSQIAGAIQKDFGGISESLDEVRFCVHKKQYDKAIHIMDGLVKEADEMPMFKNDAVSEYYNFFEYFEEILYKLINKPERDVREADYPFAKIYMEQGSLMFEVGNYLKAREALEKAIRWNPANAKIAFEHAETYKATGELDKFFELTKAIFKIAFRPDDVARCYRNLGFYFVEQEEWKVAAGCILMSMRFDKDAKNAQSELYYIATKTGGKLDEPTIEEFEEYAEKYGFPVCGDDNVAGLAYALGERMEKEEEFEGAAYCYEIVYGLSGDDEILALKERMEVLAKQM